MGFMTATAIAGLIDSSGFLVVTMILTTIVIVLTIFAVIKGMYYVLGQYIMYDSQNTLRGKEAVEKSKELMQNLRGQYFILILSFIGWGILAFAIGMILVMITSIIIKWEVAQSYIAYIPVSLVTAYMQTSMVVFYEDLIRKNSSETVEE